MFKYLTVNILSCLYRQLSEDNANLQEYVEKETNEKKRLSRNNEELLWLLQTSPHLSPSSSPIHRAFFPSPDIPPYPYSPGPGTPTHSCSPGPCTPTHRVVSPGAGTPTLRGSPAARSSPARVPNANTLPRWAVLNHFICVVLSVFLLLRCGFQCFVLMRCWWSPLISENVAVDVTFIIYLFGFRDSNCQTKMKQPLLLLRLTQATKMSTHSIRMIEPMVKYKCAEDSCTRL